MVGIAAETFAVILQRYMANKGRFNRRTLLKFAAGAAAATALSGCTETAQIHQEWGDIDHIVLEAYTDGWRGLRPDTIVDEENPTLVLYEGREYEVTIRNGDGESHLFEIPSEMDLDSEMAPIAIIDEDEAEETLLLRASPRISKYICDAHRQPMRGDIDIEMENDTGVYGDD